MFIVHHAIVLVRQYFWPVCGASRDSTGFELDGWEGDFELHCLVITGNSFWQSCMRLCKVWEQAKMLCMLEILLGWWLVGRDVQVAYSSADGERVYFLLLQGVGCENFEKVFTTNIMLLDAIWSQHLSLFITGADFDACIDVAAHHNLCVWVNGTEHIVEQCAELVMALVIAREVDQDESHGDGFPFNLSAFGTKRIKLDIKLYQAACEIIFRVRSDRGWVSCCFPSS